MKVIYSGLESGGKSLKLAMRSVELVERNSKWYKYQEKLFETHPELFVKKGELIPTKPLPRPIVSNMAYTQSFKDWATGEMGIPLIFWENLYDLIQHQDCDIIIDEVGNYFDSRGWEQLSLDARRWLTQGAKMGIEIYGGAQDFAQVDIAFRRLTNHLIHIKKVMGSRRPSNTKPPVSFIWGLCFMYELDPQTYDEKKSKFGGFDPMSMRAFLIRRRYCEIFDTTQKIKRSDLPPLRHMVQRCELDTCKLELYTTIGGHRHRIKHL